MNHEYDALIKNKTWDLVEKPKGVPVVDCKWVFKIKRDEMGNISKFKSRLVARGFTQRFGINYWDTYSPVVKNSTLRLLLAVAVEEDYIIEQIDVRNAYINSDLQEVIYMNQPKCFVKNENLVCKLNKSLYGLKQSGYEWNKCLNEKLVNELKFNRLKTDPCVYVKSVNGVKIIIAVYVDDILLFSKNQSAIKQVKCALSKFFDIDDIGECRHVLGLDINKSENSLSLKQRQYTVDILEKFQMSDCKAVSTPINPGEKLSGCDGNPCGKCGIVDQTYYRSIIGSLMFLAVSSRPDIAFAVSMLSRFNNNPHVEHITAAKRVLRYLKGTVDYELQFRKTERKLVGYVDADWGNDLADRRSYTGFVFLLAGGPISWEAKKQTTVALSSTEAEYMAVTQAAKEAMFIQHVLQELEVSGHWEWPTTLFCDNAGAIQLAKNQGYQPRTKHIDIRHHFIRELVEKQDIEMIHVGTREMIADILTKGLGNILHNYFCEKLFDL